MPEHTPPDALHVVNNISLKLWRSYRGVSWDPPHDGADPAPFADSVNSPICGIRFDPQGRAFVSTPRLVSAKTPATLNILDTNPQSGPARLTAFPSLAGNSVAATPDQSLRSVLGFHIDRSNAWLWALDQGYVAGEAEADKRAQKVVVYDLKTSRLVKLIALDDVADRRASFLNDIAVDETRKVAYISDSGLRGAPDVSAGIIVVDFASANVRRVLHKHASVQPAPGVKVISHGVEVWPGNPLRMGINGIALSPDSNTLYWTVTTGRHAHAVPTDFLHNMSAIDSTIAANVRDLGDVGGNSDGIATDERGNLYITDVTREGIVKYDPFTRTMSLLASDEDVRWPDTPTIQLNGDLIFTSSNLSQHFAGAVKPGEERFDLWRLPLSAKEP